MTERTVFDYILAGEIPCYKVYEDDWVLAFLDVNPLSPGHTLVIPKERVPFLHLLSPDSGCVHPIAKDPSDMMEALGLD